MIRLNERRRTLLSWNWIIHFTKLASEWMPFFMGRKLIILPHWSTMSGISSIDQFKS
ncbi:hypothetical protein NBRC111894_4230 [Sporolactobacillus inulinus]|uniref:Uncharacterized protein n=1 Tax=Sporolactobacillus inulinus TaxID=2078 RepID=A0A4Y1ZHI5_9BACL|nr:hypothetical protein NBRC111894_4230 [Sporolactobacillus inulinus]